MSPALLLATLVALAQTTPQEPKPAAPPAAPAPAAPAAQPAPAPQVPLGFASREYEFKWDKTLPLGLELDGLKVNSVFFANRELKASWLKDANFGTRAQVEVTNGAKQDRIPGFAVAVFDKEGRLLGVASGGTKFGVVKPGETETFDLNFTQVKERLPRGEKFVLSVELR
jgi:hypothetical protein